MASAGSSAATTAVSSATTLTLTGQTPNTHREIPDPVRRIAKPTRSIVDIAEVGGSIPSPPTTPGASVATGPADPLTASRDQPRTRGRPEPAALRM